MGPATFMSFSEAPSAISQSSSVQIISPVHSIPNQCSESSIALVANYIHTHALSMTQHIFP